jgi:hypothetical protein
MQPNIDTQRDTVGAMLPTRAATKLVAIFIALSFAITGCSSGSERQLELEAQGASSALQVSAAADRSNADSLIGATVSGDVHIFVRQRKWLTQVRFFLDDAQRQGAPYSTQYRAPFDLRGGSLEAATPWNTAELGEGEHTLSAVLIFRRGSRTWNRVVHANFEVAKAERNPRPPSAETPANAEIIWAADHSTGDMSQWYQSNGGGEFNSGGGISRVSTVVSRSGRHAAELRLTNVQGDQGVRLFRWQESRQHSDLFYSTWYYFPERYVAPNWWNVFQFKSKTSSRNDAFFQLNIGNRADGQMHFYLFDWQRRQSYPQSAANIPIGRWFQIEVYYKSRGDQSGQITVWQDGVELFNVKDVQTRYPDGDTQWSVNNYTDSIKPDPAVTYIDDALISKSRIGSGITMVATSP